MYATVSALTGTGIDDLQRCISAALQAQFVELDVLVPYDRGDMVALFHQYGTIEHESYEERGTHLRGHMPTNHCGQFAAFGRKEPTGTGLHHARTSNLHPPSTRTAKSL